MCFESYLTVCTLVSCPRKVERKKKFFFIIRAEDETVFLWDYLYCNVQLVFLSALAELDTGSHLFVFVHFVSVLVFFVFLYSLCLFG